MSRVSEAPHGSVVPAKWNATQTDFPSDSGIAQLFEAQCDRTPDAIAVEDRRTTLTYAELDRKANRLARHLRHRGVRRGSLVAILVERTAEMIVGMLAVLKAGGAYVPLDPSSPTRRLQQMLEDAEARFVLSRAAVAGQHRAIVDQLIDLDDTRSWKDVSDARLTLSTSGSDIAYVIFTSGSTGRPKGACIPHRGVARLVVSTNFISLGPHDRFAQVATATFDAATFEIWGALLNGAALVIIDKETVIDPQLLVDAISQQRITKLLLSTAVFHQVAELHPGAFRTLDQLMFGGEQVNPRAVHRVLVDGPRRTLNVYGPTETTVIATAFLAREIAADASMVPIGTPISNTTTYVLDDCMKPCAIGEAGSLYIGGPGCAIGYWRRPALTAEKFVPDPFSSEPGARLYDSGDLARWLPDGNIEFLGRRDHQFKIRGIRIELGEIEAALATAPDVGRVVVIGRDDGATEKRIVAYVTPNGGAKLSADALRAHLLQTLPEYMVPSAFVLLSTLPLTPHGKVDRKALPPPVYESTAADAAPRTPLQVLLGEIWCEALALPSVGLRDDFFAVGGQSLSAMRFVTRIKTRLGVEVPTSTVFEAPIFEDFAFRILELQLLALSADDRNVLFEVDPTTTPTG